nr:hypothetical protein [uncultured Mediterranean phage uvMED]
MPKPMSYFLFKLTLEIAHYNTFERDPWVQQQYKKYLDDFAIKQKKMESKTNSSFNSPLYSPNLK